MVIRVRMKRLPGAMCCAGMLAVAGCVAQPPAPDQVTDTLERMTGMHAGDPAADSFLMPPEVSLDDGLSENEAVALALANYPEFKAELAGLGVSAAEVVRAQLLPNPALSAVLGSSWEATLTFPLDILWKRGGRIDAARAAHASHVQQVVQRALDLMLDVRIAHIGAVLAQQQLKLADATATRTGRVERIAESRRGAGDASGLEVATTTAEAATAVRDRERARLQQQAAEFTLRRLTRLEAASWDGRLTPSAVVLPATLDGEPLARLAQENRADVRAAALEVEAAGARMGLARAEAFSFAAGAKASEGSGSSTTVSPALNAGLPIFNRGQADVLAAQATLQAATQLYRARLDQAGLEVRDAAAKVISDEASLRGWRQDIVPPLQDAVSRSERAYLAGDVPYLTVLDALRRLIDAQRAEAEAAAALQRSTATLAHHLGGVAASEAGASR